MTEVLFVDVPGSWRWPVAEWCLGYRYLVAALHEAGMSADIVHPPFVTDGTAQDRVVAEVVARSPRLVGLTTYDAALPGLLEFVAALRRGGLRAHVTLGGAGATAVPEWILNTAPGVDSVVRGEGEVTTVELARHVLRGTGTLPIPGVSMRSHGHIVSGGPRSFVPDLDDLPAPAWDAPGAGGPASLTPRRREVVPVTGSRGCYGRCTFCSIERFYRTAPHARPWRPWSAGRIGDDVERVVRATGVRKVTFVDENFIGPGRAGRAHALAVAQELRRRGHPVAFNFACRADDVDRDTFRALRDAGLSGVTLGIESMTQRTLDLFRKNTTPEVNAGALDLLAELGIDTEITYIFFTPLSTLDDLRDSLAFVSRVARTPTAYFNNGQPYTELVPLAGTALTAELRRLGHVHGGVGEYAVSYADPRVGLLARTMTGVPLDDLAMLRLALPAQGGDRIEDIRGRLGAHHRWLAMHRLSELLSDACDAFDASDASDAADASDASDAADASDALDAADGRNDRTVRAVISAVEAESARVRSLIERFLALIPPQEASRGTALPGNVLL